jgi:transposase
LRIDSNLRVLCGFEQVPGKSTFSRNFTELSETTIMEETLDKLVKEVHEGRVVYHVSRDSTAIEARERVDKEGKRGRERGEKAAWEAEKGGKAAAQRRKRAREAGT